MTSRSPFQHILFRDFKTKHTLVSKAFKKDPHLEALFLWIFKRSNADRNWALAIPLKSMEITAPHPFSRFWFRDFSDYHHGDSVWCKNSGVTSLTPSLPSQHTFPQSLHPTSDVLLHPTACKHFLLQLPMESGHRNRRGTPKGWLHVLNHPQSHVTNHGIIFMERSWYTLITALSGGWKHFHSELAQILISLNAADRKSSLCFPIYSMCCCEALL